jgi:hypothetical protein
MMKRWMGLIACSVLRTCTMNQVTVFNAPGFKNTAAIQTVESSNQSAWRMAA